MVEKETILILDFGSQYGHLLARRVREQKVFCKVVRHDLPCDQVAAYNPRGIILSGGPASVHEADAPRCDPAIFDMGIPVLGICYGMQLMCHVLGCTVKPAGCREFGNALLHINRTVVLFSDVPVTTSVWMSHGDQVQSTNEEFVAIASTNTCPIAAVRHRDRPIFGLQFHPEVSHTPDGALMIRNFLFNICGCRGSWEMSTFIDNSVTDLRRRIGADRVICGLSGGVDSAVVAALLARAVGSQVVCIYVDNGMQRCGEAASVQDVFSMQFGDELHVVDAHEKFLRALANVSDPQDKRKIIGQVFIDVFRDEATRMEGVKFLAQGTLYADVIESGGCPDGPAAMIKAHHNVGGLPQELGFELIEPLRDLFKDEVRILGRALGLPEKLVWRHPFPGPGLAVRILGPVSAERVEIVRRADAIFLEELTAAGWYDKTAQAFAVLLPVHSVGVMGDNRTYENVIALRAVQTDDYMTADWSRLPEDLLARIANRIINAVPGVNRVVYDISTKPPATIEWE